MPWWTPTPVPRPKSFPALCPLQRAPNTAAPFCSSPEGVLHAFGIGVPATVVTLFGFFVMLCTLDWVAPQVCLLCFGDGYACCASAKGVTYPWSPKLSKTPHCGGHVWELQWHATPCAALWRARWPKMEPPTGGGFS